MVTRLVAQELLSPQMVMAHCQVLGVVAEWPRNGGDRLLVEGGSGPDSLIQPLTRGLLQ